MPFAPRLSRAEVHVRSVLDSDLANCRLADYFGDFRRDAGVNSGSAVSAFNSALDRPVNLPSGHDDEVRKHSHFHVTMN
jgi:hypothetical protein